MLCHQFRQPPQRPFFIQSRQGPQHAPKRDPVRDHVMALRKQHFSLDAISAALKAEGHSLRPVAIALMVKEAGVAR